MLMKNGINFRITTLRNESLVTRARNILSAMFMESDCTHLFFIDSDIEFDSESILRALAFDKASNFMPHTDFDLGIKEWEDK